MSTENLPQVQAEVAPPAPTPSERFTNVVLREFAANAGGELQVTDFQKKLIKNYFIKIDMVLKEAELKRLAKIEKYRDALPVTWNNINIQKLAIDVVIFASVGLDAMQDNHISPIPFKDNKTNEYKISFIVGYKGMEIKSRKYGVTEAIPDNVTIELVYSKDKFKPVKKDLNNKVEGYIFEQSEEMDRGEVVGGFYYYSWDDKPHLNKLKTFSVKDIEKRKPKNASAEFWGGTKDVWQDGKKVGKEEVEGWYDEMCHKTITRAAWNAIPIDSEKIDQNYVNYLLKESESIDNQVADEIVDHANKKVLQIDAPQEPIPVPTFQQPETVPVNQEPELSTNKAPF